MGAGLALESIEDLLTAPKGAVPPVVRPELSRKHLPSLFASRGYTSGAEIGVWYGKFTEAFCKANPALHMLAVDPWTSYAGWWDSKNTGAVEQTMAVAYASARERLTPYRCTIHRGFSADVVQSIPDRSLDFVYIDGNHSYESALEDLTLWSQKVKSGGIVCGHDYCDNPAKPFLRVKPAVDEFVQARTIRPWFVLSRDQTPSFLWVNP